MSTTMGMILIFIVGLLLGYEIGKKEASDRLGKMLSGALTEAKKKLEEIKKE